MLASELDKGVAIKRRSILEASPMIDENRIDANMQAIEQHERLIEQSPDQA